MKMCVCVCGDLYYVEKKYHWFLQEYRNGFTLLGDKVVCDVRPKTPLN